MIARLTGPRGRPRKGEERPTKLVRVYEDQAELLAWVARIEQRSTAQIIDDLVASRLVKLFSEIRPHAESIKAAEDAARVAFGLEPTPPLPA